MTHNKTVSLEMLAALKKEKALFKKELVTLLDTNPTNINRCYNVLNQNHQKEPGEYPRVWNLVYQCRVKSFTIYFLNGYENTAYKRICEEYNEVSNDKQNILIPLFGKNIVNKNGMIHIKARRWAYAKPI